jgi:hypothetical protein
MRQPTWDALPPQLREYTKLVVPPKERAAYEKQGLPVICDPGVAHTGVVRQWIADNAAGNFVMLDDDLTFAIRREDFPSKFRNAMPEDVLRIFKTIDGGLIKNAHMGVAMREGANRNTDAYVRCVRMARVLAYNIKVTQKLKVRWDRNLSMDDFDATLQLIRKGYPNVVINWAVQNQYGSDAPGGASQWRTSEGQTNAANLLHKHHPEFVKVVQKKTKTAWGGKERTDVIVQWKAALSADLS